MLARTNHTPIKNKGIDEKFASAAPNGNSLNPSNDVDNICVTTLSQNTNIFNNFLFIFVSHNNAISLFLSFLFCLRFLCFLSSFLLRRYIFSTGSFRCFFASSSILFFASISAARFNAAGLLKAFSSGCIYAKVDITTPIAKGAQYNHVPAFQKRDSIGSRKRVATIAVSKTR